MYWGKQCCLLCPLVHTFLTACGTSRFKCSLPDSEPGFDAWSLSSQESGLTTKVFGDEVLQISLSLNTEGFFGERIEPCVSLARVVTTKLWSHTLLFTPVHFLYILDTSEKNSFQFLVLLNMNSGSNPKNFGTAHLLSSFLEFTCLWWWWASKGSSKPWHCRILSEDMTRLMAEQKIPGIFSLLFHIQSQPIHRSMDLKRPLPRAMLP